MKKSTIAIPIFLLFILSGFMIIQACGQSETKEDETLVWTTGEDNDTSQNNNSEEGDGQSSEEQAEEGYDSLESGSFVLPNIALRNWKVTLPVGNNVMANP